MAVFVFGSTESLQYDDVFSNNSWEEIIRACQTNTVPETWRVGDQKAMLINGSYYVVDIIGKNHDAYSDGTGLAPLTFQLHDLYGTKYRIHNEVTNIGGWTSCEMRSTTLPMILSSLPLEVQSGLREVNKLTSAGGKSQTINITADKLFLLSEVEIFGKVTYSFNGEGSQYDYYKEVNRTIKNFGVSPEHWYVRSPQNNITSFYGSVSTVGAPSYTTANYPIGLSFAFCF